MPGPKPSATTADRFVRRLLLVEDEPLTATLLAEVLAGEGFHVAVSHDVVDARREVTEFDPDCVIIDISLGPGPSGADLAHALHHERPDIALVFLTRHPDMRTAGLRVEDVPEGIGFVRKDRVNDTAYLVAAIEQVLRNTPTSVRHDADPTRPLSSLSERQLEVLRMLALGYTNEAIARARGVGLSTVERWIAGVFKDLGIAGGGDVNSRVEAVRQYVAVVGIPERP